MPKEVKSHSSRRSRSRSPVKHKSQRRRSTERRRSRSRSPKKHRLHRSRSDTRRSRSRSPKKHRSHRRRSGSRDNTKGGAVPKYLMDRPQITEKDLEGKSEEEQQMMKMMGFGNFDSTKGKHVPGNDVYAVHVVQKRKYRQYMNRKGGFNRPLDFVA